MYGKIILYKLNYPLLEVEFDALEVTKLLSEMSILFLKFGFLPKIYIYIFVEKLLVFVHFYPILSHY